MNKFLVSAAVATAAIAPTAASAQAIPAAVVAVVDLDRVSNDCNACKTAAAALRSQVAGLENRQKALAAPLEAEAKAIQAAVNALNGKPADAALENRAKAFETKRQQGAQEIARQQQQIQRNQAYVQKQISDRLNPIFTQVMQRRGANILMEMGATLASTKGIDVTNDVLAALNTALPTIQAVAPAQPQQKTPQGR